MALPIITMPEIMASSGPLKLTAVTVDAAVSETRRLGWRGVGVGRVGGLATLTEPWSRALTTS